MSFVRAALTAALLLIASTTHASPGVEGTRNMGMGGGGRSSAFGVSGALINPSNLGFNHVFAIEPMYQVHLPSRTHGIGVAVVDSLNNPRISLGLGYLFLKGTPSVKFDTVAMGERELRLSRFGHEAFAAISVAVVKKWLAIGLKPKYQYVSLRYRDDEGLAQNAARRLSAFGLDTSATLNFAGWVALSVLANNVTGNLAPPYTDDRHVTLTDVGYIDGREVDHDRLPELSEYPLTFEHGLAVFPLHHADFSLNFDGIYDFTTYRFENYTRVQYTGSAEYVLGPVPIRFGTTWDGRGRGNADDRVYVGGGLAYVKPAKVGGVGIDAGFSVRQQVTGPTKDTFLGFNLGIRIHPDL